MNREVYVTSDGKGFRTKQDAQDYLKSDEYIRTKKLGDALTRQTRIPIEEARENPFDD
jgi:hypothetical protein